MAIIKTMYKKSEVKDSGVLLRLKEMDKKRSARKIAAYILKSKEDRKKPNESKNF